MAGIPPEGYPGTRQKRPVGAFEVWLFRTKTKREERDPCAPGDVRKAIARPFQRSRIKFGQ